MVYGLSLLSQALDIGRDAIPEPTGIGHVILYGSPVASHEVRS
jgi:hypothetical protein